MRLLACSNCHTQYEVSQVTGDAIECRCGTAIPNRLETGLEAPIHRCSGCGAQVGAKANSCGYCGSEIIRDLSGPSLICPECFARNQESARYCASCGVGFRPEPIPSQSQEWPCPTCSGLMPVRSIGGIEVNECPQCQGLWVPDKRFDELIARACETAIQFQQKRGWTQSPRCSSSNPSLEKVVYRKCPVCDRPMQRMNFKKRSGVIIDHCYAHGTWLDADELECAAGFILESQRQAQGVAGKFRSQDKAQIRRDAEALARAQRGESLAVYSARDHDSAGGWLGDLLGALLN
ncbi:MAG: zf-TFIIB domain-containing protein [Myxococcota bacterium]|nr:zf-TFIIB domain-containing protein [Myxococcota bacterium]